VECAEEFDKKDSKNEIDRDLSPWARTEMVCLSSGVTGGKFFDTTS